MPPEVVVSPVVGVWKLTAITAMGQNFINDCKRKDKVEVRANKTFTITSHFEDNNCEIQMSSGTWRDNLNSTFNFTVAGETQVFTLTSDNSLTFSFQQDSETVVYSYTK
ncbi:lipocalin family protein [Polaribacter tangerinus]|uniref:lipocalin family protein n=1 Tax=Polaribacter tangerinus TaxID=1920034 RepID=UPI000B4B83B4|nr:lipocalin family protein [Polaribacter tangerinus]